MVIHLDSLDLFLSVGNTFMGSIPARFCVIATLKLKWQPFWICSCNLLPEKKLTCPKWNSIQDHLPLRNQLSEIWPDNFSNLYRFCPDNVVYDHISKGSLWQRSCNLGQTLVTKYCQYMCWCILMQNAWWSYQQ